MKMRESNRIVALLLQKLEDYIKPGISTYDICRFAENYILSKGAKPAFKGYVLHGLSPFPAAICTSVNSCIVHGIPSKKMILKEGDIIGIDIGTFKNGYCGDGARTYKIGKVSGKIEHLMKIANEALYVGIEQAKKGGRIGDISSAIGSFVKKNGYYVADNLTGHGIGKKMHEAPVVPNFGTKGKGPRLKKGMTLAIEPMVNMGTNRVHEKGWEFFVADGSLSAHFEHTILIRDGKPEILTVC